MRKIFVLSLILIFSLKATSQVRIPLNRGNVIRHNWEEWAKENLTKNFKPLVYREDTVSMIFIGDVMMHSPQIQRAHKTDGYDFSTYFKHMTRMLSAPDIAVANMEFTLGGKPYTGYPSFSAPDSYPQYVASCGVDIFLTANNHILDKGSAGIKRTISKYDMMERQDKIRYTGIAADSNDYKARYPLLVDCKGFKIAILNFTYGTNQGISSKYPKVNKIDKAEISASIRLARHKGADFIIAVPHWGVEYHLEHSESQESMAKWMVSQGVDMIIGSHPHVVQDTAIMMHRGKKVPVIYSMGNAISNMSAPNTRLELAVNVKLARDSHGDKKLLAPEIDFLWCTMPGKLCTSYSTIPVRKFIGRSGEWMDKSDYNNMIATYKRVKQATGIKD